MLQRLGVPVIAISAKKGTNVGETVAARAGRCAARSRRGDGAQPARFPAHGGIGSIRNAMLINGGIGAEPIPFIDLPLLLANQARMVLRIAAIYGEPFTANHARELISTIAGGVALRYLAQEAAKVVPVGGSAVAAGVAAPAPGPSARSPCSISRATSA